MKAITPPLLAAIIFAAPPLATADTLLLDAIAEAPENTRQGLLRPIRGQSMDEVQKHFGQPQSELSGVGDPPITRWVYEKLTVYFEYKHVIRAVVHR